MPVYLSLFSPAADRPGNVGWASSKSGLMDEAWRGKEALPGLGEEGGRRRRAGMQGCSGEMLRAWHWVGFSPSLAPVSSMEKGAAGAAAEPRNQLLEVPCGARSELEDSSNIRAARELGFPTSRTFYPLKFLSFQYVL